VDEEQQASAEASGVARVCKHVVMLAALGGMDVVAAKRLAFDFAESGDVTLSIESTDGASDEAVILAADIAAHDMGDDERPSMPPPPPAA
jgi:hypothetical protein